MSFLLALVHNVTYAPLPLLFRFSKKKGGMQIPTIISPAPQNAVLFAGRPLPCVIRSAGPVALARYVEFLTAHTPNSNTRLAYARALERFFSWAALHHIALERLNPILVSTYIEELRGTHSVLSVKQHLAAIRALGDFLVIGGVLPFNPASSVRGPKLVVTQGKTPVLSAPDTKKLLESISGPTAIDLRDRALIALMVYCFGRVGAIVAMKVEDYCGGRIRLLEKGAKVRDLPLHPQAQAYLEEFLKTAGGGPKAPLFRSVHRLTGQLTDRGMLRGDVLRMIKRRCKSAGVAASTSCHSFRATGITTFLANGGTLDQAQLMAGHACSTTTKLYDRSTHAITQEQLERIRF